MATRAFGQRQMKLALILIPIEIYPATKQGAAVTFRYIHEPTGKPVQYEKVVSGVGPFDRDGRAKSGPEKKSAARSKTATKKVAPRCRSV